MCAFARDPAVRGEGQNGDTALYMASKKGHTEVVRRLIEASANVNQPGGVRPAALHLSPARHVRYRQSGHGHDRGHARRRRAWRRPWAAAWA